MRHMMTGTRTSRPCASRPRTRTHRPRAPRPRARAAGLRPFALATLLVAAACLCASMSAPDARARSEGGGPVVVSMGDSYSSGEGIEPFYDQDLSISEKADSQDWLAHRSTLSWGGRLHLADSDGNEVTMRDIKGQGWYFVATSGATTADVNGRQSKEYDITYNNGMTVLMQHYAGTEYIDPQIDVFDDIEEGTVDYVTITMGGNDADFVGVVTNSIAAGTFLNKSGLSDKLDATWDRFYESGGIRDDLVQMYRDIAEAAGPQARIIVAGYPTLLDEGGGGALFTEEGSKLINDSVREFNSEIAEIVDELRAEGMNIYFASVEDAFAGHEAYTDDEYINGVILLAQDQDLDTGTVVSSYSVHPNDSGAQAYADCVQGVIDEIEQAVANGQDPNGLFDSPSSSEGAADTERDIVLCLDVSGSMDGEPMKQTKKAAREFVSTVFDVDASVGLVTYSSDAEEKSAFTTDEIELKSIIRSIQTGGGTNIEDGLKSSYDQLESSDAERKIILLMSDGEANEGKTGDELIEYAQTIKDEGVLIYTLGFFQEVGNKAECQRVLEGIASDGCHYEVSDASELRYFFGDIADSINGVKYMYISIECPVDVRVSTAEGVLDSSDESLATRTEFGSLTFRDADEGIEGEDSADAIKVLRLREGESYDIELTGYGEGTMDYTIAFADDDGRYTDKRVFEDVPITATTSIDTAAERSSVTTLSVDSDSDGVPDLVYSAAAGSVGRLVDNSWVSYVVVALMAALAAGAVALYVRRAR